MCPVKEGLPRSKVSKSLTSSVALLRLPLRNKQCPGNFLLPHCVAATAAAAASTQIYKAAKGSQQQPFLISFVAPFTRHKHTRAQINTRTHTHKHIHTGSHLLLLVPLVPLPFCKKQFHGIAFKHEASPSPLRHRRHRHRHLRRLRQ